MTEPRPQPADPRAVARLFALYLPQFHPVPQNDAWWGPGFTEWTNVAKAKPLFRGHVQPRLPADLGFYDLRLPEVREAQADLARAAGVEGFCYWHYWFGHGKRILERPFQAVLDSRAPDFPFSLAWANHSWTGIWAGVPNNVLLKQEYPGREDEAAHFAWARRAFEDPRYQCVDGKPVFMVFSPHGLPDSAAFIEHWRELAHKAGYPGMYFVAMTNQGSVGVDRYRDPVLAPFDGVTPLTPHDYLDNVPGQVVSGMGQRLRALKKLRAGAKFLKFGGDRLLRARRYSYADVVAKAMDDLPNEPRFLPGVLPGWDNTPRTGNRGVIFDGSTPELFEAYLRKAVDRVAGRPPQARIIVLKAWNEWAEGNFVEPDALHGHGYLDAIRRVMLPGHAAAAQRVLEAAA